MATGANVRLERRRRGGGFDDDDDEKKGDSLLKGVGIASQVILCVCRERESK